jgi:hypothetical protein
MCGGAWGALYHKISFSSYAGFTLSSPPGKERILLSYCPRIRVFSLIIGAISLPKTNCLVTIIENLSYSGFSHCEQYPMHNLQRRLISFVTHSQLTFNKDDEPRTTNLKVSMLTTSSCLPDPATFQRLNEGPV